MIERLNLSPLDRWELNRKFKDATVNLRRSAEFNRVINRVHADVMRENGEDRHE